MTPALLLCWPAALLAPPCRMAAPAARGRPHALLSEPAAPSHALTHAWWPVAISHSLEKTRPHPIQLLGRRLVLWHDGDAWCCVRDACAHRFAPLSEGRVHGGCVQCAYHGWAFRRDGSCARVPQAAEEAQPAATRARVERFLTREEAGMVWVWGDSSEDAEAKSEAALPLPISPLLRQQSEALPQAGFMRDLPYGYELLGENLLDLSHLPFSHHGLALLNRADAQPLQLRPISRSPPASSDVGSGGRAGASPTFSVAVENAPAADPILVSMASRLPSMVDADTASVNISFFSPHHVRYERILRPGVAFNVELFLCPTTAGHSRVFLFNTAAQRPPLPPLLRAAMFATHSLRSCQRLLLGGKPARRSKPGSADDHAIANEIFDGDGVFLHYQGQRMAERELTFRDYFIPTSADSMVIRFRRWLASAQESSPELQDMFGHKSAHLDTRLPGTRAALLDRYESHTRHCSLCSAELARVRSASARCARLSELCIAMVGGAVAACVGRGVTARVGSLIAGVGLLAVMRLERAKSVLGEYEKQFVFKDHVHAEKD